VNDPDGSDVKLRIFGRTGPNRGFRIKDCIRIVQPAEQPAVLNDPTVIR
jgi:hypothetical protein